MPYTEEIDVSVLVSFFLFVCLNIVEIDLGLRHLVRYVDEAQNAEVPNPLTLA